VIGLDWLLFILFQAYHSNRLIPISNLTVTIKRTPLLSLTMYYIIAVTTAKVNNNNKNTLHLVPVVRTEEIINFDHHYLTIWLRSE
jgi:hypothetical protein